MTTTNNMFILDVDDVMRIRNTLEATLPFLPGADDVQDLIDYIDGELEDANTEVPADSNPAPESD